MIRYSKKTGTGKKSNLFNVHFLVSVILFGVVLTITMLRFIVIHERRNWQESFHAKPLYVDSFKFPNTSKMNSSYRDRRVHRFTELPNGLRAVVISEPQKFRSSVALNVAIGSAYDPVSHMGLAHLLEHMMFFGSKKYPDSNSFDRYVQVHGGMYNAVTRFTDSTFFYEIPNQYLEQSLDMFGQLFIGALLDKKHVQGEIGVVNEEYQVYKNIEEIKLDRLMKYVSSRNHSFFQFSCGNFDTLNKKDIHTQLTRFYQELYSSNLVSPKMKVVCYNFYHANTSFCVFTNII